MRRSPASVWHDWHTMKLSLLRRGRSQGLSGITGPARLDRRTRSIVKRIRPGDIAIIDHVDIDRAAAVALVEAGVAVVVNLAPSVSGRYPNLGPEALLAAGVVLVDNVDPEVFSAVADGDLIRVDEGDIYKGEELIAHGVLQDAESVAASLDISKIAMASRLDAFSANAMEHLRRERGLLLDGEGVPDVTTSFAGRHVLIVRRAFEYASELKSLKTYIRENSPVLIGVDDGADALLGAGYRPDVIVTDLDDASDAALQCGAEVVVHSDSDGRPRQLDRLERLTVSHTTFVTGGTSEDAAILLAHAHRARLIVLVGSHSTLLEFLDIGRSGMASSFLTRAAAGSSLVDARAVAQLYSNRIRGWLVLLLVLLAVALVAAAIATTPVGQGWWDSLRDWLNQADTWVRSKVG
jgi:uncharacterized membrane-anchored protein